MEDFALTSAERALLIALNRHGVRFLVIGLGAAVLQGAPLSTQDVDLWLERPGDEHVRKAAAEAGGFWVSPFGLQPPAFGGDGLERMDVVLTAHGLDWFDAALTSTGGEHVKLCCTSSACQHGPEDWA